MKNKELDIICNKISNQKELTSDKIPDLDLYMDQILTLFDDHLSDDKRYPDDKLLTKTMINNYSKAGIISKVKGKKYTKEQILQMLFIYNLKNSLSIQEIKEVLAPIYDNEESIVELYDQFIDIKNNQNNNLQAIIDNEFKDLKLDLNNDKDRLMMIMTLTSLNSSINKVIENIIDNYKQD